MSRHEDRERKIFEASLELAPAERNDFIRDACGGSRELERRIHRLLAAHARADDGTVHVGHRPTNEGIDRVGPYTLVERIGEGGMGVVYLAEQKRPVRRRVALKLIKAGMDTREVVARFHSERQALALMSHPNIARILEAGATASGRPFLVMEYVPGMPLLEYCDRHELNVHERVRLFVDICMAVQHAHQKGVIHRDIKPSNILVMEEDGRPTAKVIDFGVAKAVNRSLSDMTLHTRIGGFIGTPEYVSPEQADATALDVDTRADVYSLGAVLYELLCGLRPFEFHDLGFAEIQKTICERDPTPPSARAAGAGNGEARARSRHTDPESLVRTLRGDLDWITMKAMEKDRARRYSSASELAADLNRHLTRQPVLAGPPSRAYRLSKLARRHAVLLVVAGIGLLALVAGIVGTTFGLFKARQEAHRARVQAAIAEEVNTFLNEDLLAAVAPEQMGIAVSVREVLDRAAERVEGKFGKQPLVEASLRGTIGTTYRRLGEYAAAEPHLTRALELRRGSQGASHPETLTALAALGGLYRRQGRHAEAEPLLRRVLEERKRILGEDHPQTLYAMENLGVLYERMGRRAEAEKLFLDCLEAWTRRDDPENPRMLGAIGNLSILYQQSGQYEQAERLQLEVWNSRLRTVGEEHPETLNAVINLTALYLRQERYEDAEPLMVKNLEALRRVMGPEHPRTLMTINNLGWLYEHVDRFAEAERLYEEALEIKRRVVGDEHPSTLESIDNLIRLYQTTGRTDKVEAYTIELLETRKRKAERPDASPLVKNAYASLLLNAEPKRLRDPRAAVRFALEANAATDYTNAEFLHILAEAHYATGDRGQAIEMGERALSRMSAEQTSDRSALEQDLARYRDPRAGESDPRESSR